MSTKNKDNLFQEFIEKAMSENTETPSIPSGIPTLLNIPERKELPALPETGRRSLLYDLIEFMPETYAQYIMYLRGGAFFNTAAEAVGISEKTVYDWGYKGRKDFEAGEDSYYARFYQDVRKAVAYCRVIREQAIAQLDPKKWLSQGPGKIFGKQWADSLKEEIDDSTETPFLLIKQAVIESKSEGVKTMIIEMTPDTEGQVMAELNKVLNRKKVNAAEKLDMGEYIEDDVLSESE